MSELMPYQDASNSIGRWAAVLVPAAQLAERIAGTEFVPAAMRGKPDVVVAAIMYGDEIGVGPMQALAGIHVVDGRPQPSAELMRALIFRAGHQITIHQSTGEVVRISGLRAGHPESNRVTVTWSIDMARSAGLLHKQNWQKYPRAMLLAAASRDLARLLFADVIKGLSGGEDADPGEWEAWAASTGPGEPEGPPVPPRAPRAVTRRREGAKRIPDPGYSIATEDSPGPDGSVDVPLPESVPDGEPEPEAVIEPGGGGIREGAAAESTESAALPPSSDPLPPTPAGEPDPGPPHMGMMGDRQRRAVFAAFERIGITGRDEDRSRRLALAALMLGKPVDSFSDVTRQDGFTITRLANDIETGTLAWDEQAGTLRRMFGEPPDAGPPE